MKNPAYRLKPVLAGFTFTLALLAGMTACTIDSADSVYRSVDANVSGVYRADSDQNGGKLVSQNSGAPVTQLDLRQTGDNLEAIDNNNFIFRGTIGSVLESSVTFTLEGKTTAGSDVILSGTIDIGDSQGIMRGTWIEDTLYATVYGVADGPTINTNTPSTGGLAISPSGAQTVAVGSTRNFSATGGTSPYSWSVSSTNGSISPASGSTTTYTAGSAGSVTLTLRDSTGATASVSITNN